MSSLFDDAEIISVYTRQDAIDDGVLVDVSDRAREAGFKLPVAVTSGVWDAYVRVPKGVTAQDESGRLWDILWMCSRAALASGRASSLLFGVHVRNDNRERTPPLRQLRAVIGGASPHDPLPVITIMLPEES